MTKPRAYASDATFAAFPLGGIGTGTISLGARGDLRDFELFGHPDKGQKPPFSFFAIRAKQGDTIDARVLEADVGTNFYQGCGYHPNTVAGLAHFQSASLSVRYPFANIDFADETFPLSVSLTAFTPFIPLEAEDSAIPAAFFRYRVKNTQPRDIEVSVAATMPNLHAFDGMDAFGNYKPQNGLLNTFVQKDGLSGVLMDGDGVPKGHYRYANNAIMTRESGVSAKPNWRMTGWWDGIYDFWDDFRANGALTGGQADDKMGSAIGISSAHIGSLGVTKLIPAGGEATFEFVLSWYVPNRIKGWPPVEDPEAAPTIRNHYATIHESAWDAGAYLLSNMDRLEAASGAFADAVYASTLPEPVIDAVTANITVLRSTTCFRIEDGTFAAWEGSHAHVGSCRGTCTHVWNYAQTVAFLFPELEISARKNEFLRETDERGKMAFRSQRMFDLPGFDMLAAADGQLGTIVRAYREWILTGDDAYLREIWPAMKRALAYTQEAWDKDGDELLEDCQHNTYDIEFFGVNPLTGVMYLAALAAMEKMAEAMGEGALAAEYARRRSLSAERLDRETFGGEFFIQRTDDVNAHPYQFGEGCLSDQLLGQTFAYLTGLGALLPADHLRSAAKAIFDHNYLRGDQRGECLQRLYVAPDEAGLVLASWPNGGKPKLPFVYADEVWTGIEYQVATLLLYEGLIDEALTIVETVRARQDGVRRNPWNEVECGFHYARSLASWGLLIALSGASYQGGALIGFSPLTNADDFRCFYSTGDEWGILRQQRGEDGQTAQSIHTIYSKKRGGLC